MKLLSIIIPCYNAEKYLDKLIESLLCQNIGLNEYELLFIDDGSCDNTLDLLKKYAISEDIKVIKQENKGVSAARNTGLRYAVGEYIWFIDADDFIKENILKTIFEILNKVNPDIISFDKIFYYKDDDIDNDNITVTNDLVKEKKWNATVWNNIYKRFFLLNNNIFFPEDVIYAEDKYFNFCVYCLTNNCYYLNKKIYFWRQTEGTASRTFYKKYPQVVNSYLKLSLEYKKFIEDKKLSSKNKRLAMVEINNNIHNCIYYCILNEKKYNEVKKLIEEFKKLDLPKIKINYRYLKKLNVRNVIFFLLPINIFRIIFLYFSNIMYKKY